MSPHPLGCGVVSLRVFPLRLILPIIFLLSAKIKANDKEGVLKITLPKSEEAGKKTINVKTE